MSGDESIRGGYYGPREIAIMIAIPLLIIGILCFVGGEDINTYCKMKANMNTSQQIAEGIVTNMDCYCAYGFSVTIGEERYWFDLAGEYVPLLEYNKSYTIYWYWGVVGYGAGGCCRYAKYVDYIEDENGDGVPFSIKWNYWEEYMKNGGEIE